MIKKLKSRWLYPLGLALLFSSCEFNDIIDTDIKGVTVSPTIAVPLAFGSLSINDLLGDADSANLRIYDSGPDKDVLYLYYEQTMQTQDISGLIELPNKSVNRNINVNPSPNPDISFNNSPTDVDVAALTGFDNNLEFDLNLPDEKIDRVLFTAGGLHILAEAGDLDGLELQTTITFPGFKKNGIELEVQFITPTQGNEVDIDLTGYTAEMDANKFSVRIDLIAPAGSSGTIHAGETLNLTLRFGGLDYDFIEGFFGNQVAELPDETLEIGAFENVFEDVEVSLAAPRISVEVVNKYGIPVEVNFLQLEARNSTGSLPITLNPPNPITCDPPAVRGDSVITTVFVTNAGELLDFAPTSFYYNVEAEINKDLTDGDNFIDKSSDLKVRMKVEVPFIGSASNIVLSDTMDIDLSEVEDSEIEFAALKIKATNQLPIDATLQIYLLRDDLTVIGTLLQDDQSILVGSETSSDGTPTTAGVLDDEIEIDKQKLDNLFAAKKIIIEARLQTSDNPKDVKFRTTDKVDVKLGFKATLKLSAGL